MGFKKLSGHILIVDDEDIIRELLKMFLEDFGFTVDEAENGNVAIEKFKHRKYDVVITDMNMPKMKGDRLIEELGKAGYLKDTKAFAITGGVDTDTFRHWGVGIITKPFTQKELYQQLDMSIVIKQIC